jgi:hypothetical protein
VGRLRDWVLYVWECHTFTVIVFAIWQAQLWTSFLLYRDGTTMDWASERLGGHSDDSWGAFLAVGVLGLMHLRGRAKNE